MRIQVIEIPTQDVISRDNVSMKVDAVLYFHVVNPERAIIQVQHYLPATNMLAQTTLREAINTAACGELTRRENQSRSRRSCQMNSNCIPPAREFFSHHAGIFDGLSGRNFGNTFVATTKRKM